MKSSTPQDWISRMVVKQQTGRGFNGISDYLLHDKGGMTAGRVSWTHMENLPTDRAQWAWRHMARTAMRADEIKRRAGKKRTGRKQQKPVFHLSLSWAKDEAPTKDGMIVAGKEVLEKLGLQEHQTLFVCHNDEPQAHIHLLVNRVNHETGIMNRLSRSKRRLSAWAMQYELRQGKIRCRRRVENNRALHQGQKPRYKDPAINEAWERSDSGRGFQVALAEKGYVLARGNRRIVVVDPYGKAINPARELYGVNTADIEARLDDLDPARLPTVADVKQRRSAIVQEERPTVRQAFNRAERGGVKGNSRPERPQEEPGRRWSRPFEGILPGRMDSARAHFREAGADPPRTAEHSTASERARQTQGRGVSGPVKTAFDGSAPVQRGLPISRNYVTM